MGISAAEVVVRVSFLPLEGTLHLLGDYPSRNEAADSGKLPETLSPALLLHRHYVSYLKVELCQGSLHDGGELHGAPGGILPSITSRIS